MFSVDLFSRAINCISCLKYSTCSIVFAWSEPMQLLGFINSCGKIPDAERLLSCQSLGFFNIFTFLAPK